MSRLAPANVAQAQLSVALTWVGRGFPVVPCSRDQKRALERGFRADAAADELAPFGDPGQVRAWWSGRFKRAHVGLLTGRSTTGGRGLVVVDLDMPKPGMPPLEGRWAGCAGGTDVLELLMREAGADWPDTYTVMTPSGGLHLYYQQPEFGDIIGCATGAGQKAPYDRPLVGPHLGPLIDVRGIGGYVIAAGSYSAVQGRPYTRESAPDLMPQPLPAWLLGLLRRPAPAAAPPTAAPVRRLPVGTRAERYATAALTGELDKVAGAPEGERNRALFAAARRLGELSATAPAVLGETAVGDELLAAARSAGVAEREALRTIRSGWERGAHDGSMGGAA